LQSNANNSNIKTAKAGVEQEIGRAIAETVSAAAAAALAVGRTRIILLVSKTNTNSKN
jgi:hypothetical protein